MIELEEKTEFPYRADEQNILTDVRGTAMKDKLFEPYYKLGFDYFIFKKVLGLKRPKKEAFAFYLTLMSLILAFSLLLG